MARLTAASIERIKADPARRLEVSDALCVGLYLIIQPSGARSWGVRYRLRGRPQKLTLGRVPTLGLAEARQLARSALLQVAEGVDPAADKRAAKAPPVPAKPEPTFARIVGEFLENYCQPRQRTAAETARVLRKEAVPHWDDRLLVDITRADVNELLRSIVMRGSPYTSNRLLAYLRKFWGWAVDEGYAEFSPVAGIKKKGVEVVRDRVLSDDEIRILWGVWCEQGWPWGPLQKLLLVTGARRDEVAGMRWDEINIKEKLWTLSRERMKSDRAHLVPLSPLALTIIESLPRFESPFAFPRLRLRRKGDADIPAALSGFSKAKEATDALVGKAAVAAGFIEPGETFSSWRWHDLRRSLRTNLSRLKVSEPVAEAVLGHAPKGLIRVYDQWHFLDEKRAALDAWSTLLTEIIAVEPAIKPAAVHAG